MEGQRHWYVIHTYSGYENKVKANIDKAIDCLLYTSPSPRDS